MNAALVRSFDTPPQYADFADPQPSENEAVVEVTAAALHPIVRALASGKHYGSTGQLPFIPGVDGVGRLADGTRIFFGATQPPFGTFAERSVTMPNRALRLPDTLDDATAAAIMNPGMSSWGALSERAQFQPGEAVLIQGATGSAGGLAVQICRRRGASRIVVTGRNPQALEKLRALGADAAISLEQERDALVQAFRDALTEHQVSVILDYLWGPPAEALLAAITQRGLQHASRRIRYVQIGSMAGATIAMPAEALRSSGLEMVGSGFGSVSIERIFVVLGEFLQEAGRQPFQFAIQTAPLADVEKLWAVKTGARLVFQP
jgi:NADPH:quinone reductase-like Zn-dependent oxidoreductase